jgi:mono/diheme cytochrome c family protein
MLLVLAQAVHAQEANGAAVFNESCATCHGDNASDSRAAKLGVLRLQAAESVLQVLTTGVMRSQAARLNPSEGPRGVVRRRDGRCSDLRVLHVPRKPLGD